MEKISLLEDEHGQIVDKNDVAHKFIGYDDIQRSLQLKGIVSFQEIKERQIIEDENHEILAAAVSEHLDEAPPKKLRVKLFFSTFTEKHSIIFVSILMIFVTLMSAALPMIIKKYGAGFGLDIFLVSLLRGSIPPFLYLLTALIFEGKFKFKFPLKEYFIIGSLGLIGNFFSPSANNLLALTTSASFATINAQLPPIFNTIASYIFKIEQNPNKRSPGTILILIGVIVSVAGSLALVSLNFDKSLVKSEKLNDWILASVLAFLGHISQAFFLCYQMVRYTKEKNSPLYNKPITFLAVSGIFSTIVGTPILSVVFGVRWNMIYPSLQSYEVWLTLIATTLFGGFLANLIVGVCNSLSSPLFVGSLVTAQIIPGLLLAYFVLDEKLQPYQYINMSIILFGVIVVMIGKYLIKRKSQ